jgi:gliding motility-associated protein GldC
MTDSPKTSEIRLKVSLNTQKVPVDIKWMATDSSQEHFTDCKAFNLALWDPVESNSLSINLWTEDMQTHEMHSFFLRALMQQTESYTRATGNPFANEMMRDFVQKLAKQTSDWENELNK